MSIVIVDSTEMGVGNPCCNCQQYEIKYTLYRVCKQVSTYSTGEFASRTKDVMEESAFKRNCQHPLIDILLPTNGNCVSSACQSPIVVDKKNTSCKPHVLILQMALMFPHHVLHARCSSL